MQFLFAILVLMAHGIMPNQCRYAGELSTITFETKYNEAFDTSIGKTLISIQSLSDYQYKAFFNHSRLQSVTE